MDLEKFSLVVQLLGICTSTAEGTSLIPGWGTKILQTAQCSQKENEFRGLKRLKSQFGNVQNLKG